MTAVSPRLAAAVAAGRLAGKLSAALGRGRGDTIGGKITLSVAPDAMRRLAKGRRVIIITGTNGKSTTTRMTVAALGGDVCTNASGSNLPAGIVSALSASKAPHVVLEVDELYVPSVIAAVDPELVMLLNLSRDQLDRTHEVARAGVGWRTALSGHRASVIGLANDPHVVLAASGSPSEWVGAAAAWLDDVGACPQCGRPLASAERGWTCECGLREPAPTAAVEPGSLTIGGETYPLRLGLPGRVNETNAAFAVLAAAHFGVAPAVAIERIAAIRDVAGRYATFEVGGRPSRLLLAKNPASWVSALEIVEPGAQVVIAVNARVADGADTSWLWDVPFEGLAGREIGVLGDRNLDLAVRLDYAGVHVVRGAGLDEVAAQLPPGPLDVIGNYTAFQDIRRQHVG